MRELLWLCSIDGADASLPPDQADTGAETAPLLRVHAAGQGRTLLMQLWPQGADAQRGLHRLEQQVARALDGGLVRSRTYPVHQLGSTEFESRPRGDTTALGHPVLNVVQMTGNTAELLAMYDAQIGDVDAGSPTTPLVHVAAPIEEGGLLTVNIWDSAATLEGFRASEPHAQLQAVLGDRTTELNLPIVDMAWHVPQPEVSAEFQFQYPHRFTVYYRGGAYQAHFHPRRVDDCVVGYVVNVFDRNGRTVGGSDIQDAPTTKSGIDVAHEVVRRLVRDSMPFDGDSDR